MVSDVALEVQPRVVREIPDLNIGARDGRLDVGHIEPRHRESLTRVRDRHGGTLPEAQGPAGKRAPPTPQRVKMAGPTDMGDRLGIVSFTIEGVDSKTCGAALDNAGLLVCVGRHCAQPLTSHRMPSKQFAGQGSK
ncbi:MAG: aminotransferase class V-fold PLP-dependent enzyme [Bifidobacteriaceae bacterium]|nr:aminotransferase class V-fold PLP-dependent enzyme [Bifidobacteriaceae bacterium]